jgi:HEAT repeat protein
MPKSKRQINVRTLLVLVACCGAVAGAWLRATAPSHPPTSTLDWIGVISSGHADERKDALRRIEPTNPAEAETAIVATSRALEDADAEVRLEAAIALGRFARMFIGTAEPEDLDRVRSIARTLLEVFRRDTDVAVRASAASSLAAVEEALTKAGIRPGDFPEEDPLRPESLVETFDDGLRSDPANRIPLLMAIERIGTVPRVAPPGVLSVLDDPTHLVRGQALLALSHFSGGVDRAIPILLDDVVTNTDRFPPDYDAIARAIHPSPAVVPALIKALGSKSGIVRETAATLLTRIEPPPVESSPAVIAAVKEALSAGDGRETGRDFPDREPAASKGVAPGSGIQREEPPPGLVSPDLAVLLAKLVPPEQSAPLLLQLMHRRDPASRSAASEGLAEVGPAAHEAIPVLVETLKMATDGGGRSTSGYGSRAARALGRIAPRSPEAKSSSSGVIAALSEALNARTPSIRMRAAEALGQFGPEAATAAPRLRELLQAREANIRDAAAAALEAIEPKAPASREAKAP